MCGGLVRYLAGATLARTADAMSGPALLLLGLAVVGSAGPASLLFAGLTVASAVGGPVAVAVAVLGVADGPQLAAVIAGRHREAPRRLRAQVFTTGASLKVTAGAVGAASAGVLAAHSLTLVLLVAAGTQVVALVGFAVGWPWWVSRRRRQQRRRRRRPGCSRW